MELPEKLSDFQTFYFASKIWGLEVQEFLHMAHLKLLLIGIVSTKEILKKLHFRSRWVHPCPFHNSYNQDKTEKGRETIFRDNVRLDMHNVQSRIFLCFYAYVLGMLKNYIMCLDFALRHNISSTLPLKCIPTQKIRKFCFA